MGIVCTDVALRKSFEDGLSIMEKAGYPQVRRINYVVNLNGRLSSTLGRCARKGGYVEGINTCEIDISKHYFEQANEDYRLNTIVHELAHSVCPLREGHGDRWKIVARKASVFLTIPIERCATDRELAQAQIFIDRRTRETKKYSIICNKCGHTWKQARPTSLIKTKMAHHSIAGYTCPYCKGNQWTVACNGIEII